MAKLARQSKLFAIIGLSAALIACGGSDGANPQDGVRQAAPNDNTVPEAGPQGTYGDTRLFSQAEPDDGVAAIPPYGPNDPPYTGKQTRPKVNTKDAAGSVTSNANVIGAWSPVRDWPLIAIHAGLLPDGRVITYGTNADGKQTGRFIYDVWDSTAARADQGHLTLPNTTQTDIFCSALTVLPSTGELLIAGGDNFVNNKTTNTGNNNSTLFSGSSNSIRNGPNMNRARWYASVATLPDGRTYVQGGTGGTDRPELRQSDGSFTLLGTSITSPFSYWFPRNYVSDDGRFFGFDVAGRLYYNDPLGTGYVERLTTMSADFAGTGSSTAMYAPNKILQVGGNTARVMHIDINQALPQLSEVASLSSKRFWNNATILADGKVVVTGGSRVANALTDVNNFAEIWNPDTGTWTLGAEAVNARLYHSTALLLPDATVLVAGGGAPGPLTNTNVEIYYPPYLYAAAGQLAPRPVITTAPPIVSPGQRFSISMQDTSPIGEVALIRTGAVTHSYNFDQRRMPLPFVQNGNKINLQMPASGAKVPPGYYLLFVLDQNGVPSIAPIIRVNVGDPARIGADWTGRIGGAGGGEFKLECQANEVLVGVHGSSAGSVVNRMGPRCVSVSANGNWLGDPVNRGQVGNASGSAYQHTCAQHSAVSGMKGRSDAYVNQITLSCRPLQTAGRLTGTASTLPAIGGNGGTARRQRDCGFNRPAYALYGRSGSWLDTLGLLCRGDQELENRTPTVDNPGEQTSIVQRLVDLAIVANDPDNESLSFSAQNLPAGLVLNASTGRITGTVSTESTQTTSIEVSDGFYIVSVSFDWAVIAEPVDTDGDGIADVDDPDDDNDGHLDGADAFPLDANEWLDTDGDGTGNNADTDDDNDGVPDVDDGDPLDPNVGVLPLNTIVGQLSTTASPVQTAISLSISLSQTLDATTYEWNMGDGSSHSTDVPSTSHSYAAAGRYEIQLTVKRGSLTASRHASQAIHQPLSSRKASNSTTVFVQALSGANDRVWAVNPDQNTVSVVDAVDNSKLAEIAVGENPRSVAADAANRVFVVNTNDASVSVIDTQSLAVSSTIALPAGSSPHGLVIDTVAKRAYVALENRHSVLVIDLQTLTLGAELDLGAPPRHMAITADGSQLLVARFVTAPAPGESGRSIASASPAQIFTVNAASMTLGTPITLAHITDPDTSFSARGVPNYLHAPVISPDALTAVVPFKSDNIFRGVFRDGNNREHDQLIRAKLGRITMSTGLEDHGALIDFENNSPPTAASFGPTGNYLVVVHRGSRFVEFMDAYNGATLTTVFAGHAPMGVALSADGSRTFVHNFLDRSLSVFDTSGLMQGGSVDATAIATVDLTAAEQLDAQVLIGKRLFYDAQNPQLVRENYFGCVSCHDAGGHDGRTWDMADVGEGLRNTIDLRGKSGTGHGNVHWTANFDEIHDFENDIRGVFKGTGLLSDADFNATQDTLGTPKAGRSAELDALAAYVTSLGTVGLSPFRASGGALSTAAQAGRTVFARADCGQCHSGSTFTDSPQALFHDIGTVDADTGQRLGSALENGGLDTPTLRGLWLNAPYLHDGSAATVKAAILAHTSAAIAFDISTLTPLEIDDLAAYVLQIDDSEASAPGSDFDGDGIPDADDPDDDNDGVDDTEDAFPRDPGESLDTDADGIGNNADTDDDGDGVLDTDDAFPLDASETLDTDGDGTGNNSDDDDDGDGVPDTADAFPLDRNESVDTDGDGTGNNADTDDDGDGVLDTADAFPLDSSETLDTDGDGIGNNADSDDDGDGVPDVDDLDPLDPTIGAGQTCNLVPNGEFETDISSWSSNTTPSRVTEASAGQGAIRFEGGWISVAVPAASGTMHTVKGMYTQSGTGGWVGFGMDFLNASGDEIGEQVQTLEPSSEFAELALEGLAPIGTTTIRLWFYADSNRTITLDQIDLRKTGCTAGGGNVNQAPFVANPGNQLSDIGEAIDLAISASDPEQQTLSYSATGLPAGLQINSVTGQITGTPSTVQTVPVVVSASDGELNGSAELIWTINDPTIDPPCNRLSNGGFETGFTNWAQSGSAQIVADAFVGNSAAQFAGGWVSYTLPANAATNYTVSGHYKSLAGTPWIGHGIDFLDAQGNEIADQVRSFAQSGTYRVFSLAATTPQNTAAVRLWFYAGEGRTLSIDDIDFRETGCTSGGGGGGGGQCNAVDNHDFEQGLDGWFTNTTPQVSTDADAGSQAMLFSAGWVSTTISAQPNTGYTASAQVKPSGDTGWTGFGMDFIDSAGTKITDSVQTVSNSTIYSATSTQAISPAGTTAIRLWFYADPGRQFLVDTVDMRMTGCQ